MTFHNLYRAERRRRHGVRRLDAALESVKGARINLKMSNRVDVRRDFGVST